jgi:AraC-like DNA-binding protein
VIANIKQRLQQKEIAHFEQIVVPADQSFVWRMDDYPNQRSVWNYHPEIEIHLIRHSSGLCYVGDHIGQFNAGQLVLIGSNMPHNWVTPLVGANIIRDRDVVIQFDPVNFQNLANTVPEFLQLGKLFQQAARGIEFEGDTAKIGASLIARMKTSVGLIRLAQLVELLGLLSKAPKYRMLATPMFLNHFRFGTPTELQTLEMALKFIQQNFVDGIGLPQVAQSVGMSDSTFSRFFKVHTGNSFSDHILSLKMWAARKLLSEQTVPITEICYESGFKNISNFNRTFLRHANMTPSQYRKAVISR